MSQVQVHFGHLFSKSVFENDESCDLDQYLIKIIDRIHDSTKNSFGVEDLCDNYLPFTQVKKIVQIYPKFVKDLYIILLFENVF